MGKRQKCALETKAKIICAVRALLLEKTADALNIEDITTKAGIAKGSFYTHFKRKEDVISVIAMEEYDVLKKSVVKSDETVQAKISRYLLDSAEIIEKNTLQIAQNWLKSVAAPLDGENHGVSKYNYDRDAIINILRNAVESEELKDDTPIDELTECIVNVHYGAVASWCITKGKVALLESMKQFCAAPLKALLADNLV